MGVHDGEIGVGEDYCIPPTFRREHQFNGYLLRTTNQAWHLLSAHPIGLYRPATGDLHTLARSRQAWFSHPQEGL